MSVIGSLPYGLAGVPDMACNAPADLSGIGAMHQVVTPGCHQGSL
jgi:hypothetical protein